MTSKERVLKAVNHEITDKVPVDLGSNIQATIHAYAYHNLKQGLGLSTDRIEIMDTYIMAAKVEDTVIDALHPFSATRDIDIAPHFPRSLTKGWDRHTLPQEHREEIRPVSEWNLARA